ncbi:MAG: TetR/AcrR family transcriptional regulator [Stackebrandtia sp.]
MSPKQRSSYHHGSLREELMTACLALIEAEGIGAVSLRRVAREAGVSPGAPYHHFTDRSQLLGALSIRGFEQLVERMRAAEAGAQTPQRELGALLEAYVRFAREQSAYFRLMFRPELTGPDKHPDVRAAGDAAFAVLVESVARYQADGSIDTDPGTLATMLWSLAHGLASLWLDGPLQDKSAKLGVDPERLAEQVVRAMEQLLSN